MTAGTDNAMISNSPDNAWALRYVWLEITGKCQLSCVHCYAESGPKSTHGSLNCKDWHRVIDQAAELGAETVQFLGGEPTLHPDLPTFISHASSRGLDVEVFSNLTHISSQLWDTFTRPGVSLAFSFYSDDAQQHEDITKQRGSFQRTIANIRKAIDLGIPLRADVIGINNEQQLDKAKHKLEAMGVTQIGADNMRQIGRGVRDRKPGIDQLCGNCTNGVLAISPTGDVWPCALGRWLVLGNVQEASLPDIIADSKFAETQTNLRTKFAEHRDLQSRKCFPFRDPAKPKPEPPTPGPRPVPQPRKPR